MTTSATTPAQLCSAPALPTVRLWWRSPVCHPRTGYTPRVVASLDPATMLPRPVRYGLVAALLLALAAALTMAWCSRHESRPVATVAGSGGVGP